jgi:hypothetical protein
MLADGKVFAANTFVMQASSADEGALENGAAFACTSFDTAATS